MPSYVGGCFKGRCLKVRAQSHDTPKYYVLIPRNMPAGISSQLLLAIITDVEHWNRIEVIK